MKTSEKKKNFSSTSDIYNVQMKTDWWGMFRAVILIFPSSFQQFCVVSNCLHFNPPQLRKWCASRENRFPLSSSRTFERLRCVMRANVEHDNFISISNSSSQSYQWMNVWSLINKIWEFYLGHLPTRVGSISPTSQTTYTDHLKKLMLRINTYLSMNTLYLQLHKCRPPKRMNKNLIYTTTTSTHGLGCKKILLSEPASPRTTP